MRKITQESVNAFFNRQNFRKDNTEVVYDSVTKQCTMYLYGNRIAHCFFSESSAWEFRLFDGGWETKTTKERLNGILNRLGHEKISQKKGVWYIGEEGNWRVFESGCFV